MTSTTLITASAVVLSSVAFVLFYSQRQGRRRTLLMQSQLRRERALVDLGRKMATAPTVESAARIIADVARHFFEWDACHLNMYLQDLDRMDPVINIDTLEGRFVDVPHGYLASKPSPLAREIIDHGAKLLLRENSSPDAGPDLHPFGDKSRRSASLMFVPIRDSSRIIGIFSIQSYTPYFYDEEKLQWLQALADHAGGTLERIRTREELQKAHDELEGRIKQRTAELTNANALLLASQEEQRTIFDSMPASLTYKNAHGRILRVNRFHCEFMGRPAGEIEGRTVSEINPTYAGDILREDQEIITSGQPKFGLLRRYEDSERGVRWLQADKFPYRDPAGNVIGVIAFSLDVTERKKMEEKLQKAREELESRIKERTAELSEAVSHLEQEVSVRRQAEIRATAFSRLGQELSAATTASAAAQVVLDVADRLLGWDAAYIHFYTPDLRYTVPILMFDIVDGQRTEIFGIREITERDRRIIEHGAELVQGPEAAGQRSSVPFGVCSRPTPSRMYVPIYNGAIVSGAVSIQSYRENAYVPEDLKSLQAMANFCSGTLERIRIEQSLRQSEERFSKAFRSSPVPMSITTLKEGVFLDVNDSFLKLLGYEREEVVGRTSNGLDIWPEAEARAKLVDQLQERRQMRNYQCQMRAKNGVLHEILLSIEQLEFGGESVILAILYDVTERLSLEAQLRHSQKMEAVGQLAAGVAHDFNNVLTIIQGHVGLMLTTPALPGDLQLSLRQVSQAADRAGNLTKQLLTFSRKQFMQLHLLDLNDIIRGTAQILQRLMGESVVLRFNYSSAPASLEADAGMMEQILMNLAVNARDAMPHGGEFTVSVETIQVTQAYVNRNVAAREGLFVCLTVADTGCGMNAETLARIFEPFFTTKEVGRGTGLGLATVYAIAQQHGGWIEVSSAAGSGSVFKIFLPGSAAAVPQGKSNPRKVAHGRDETIFVVEDEASLRELVCGLLKHYGYQVIEACHGPEALGIWRKRSHEIDLLLTDMMMPEGISGWELAEMFLKDRPELKVIYTSGYSVDLFSHNGSLRDGVNFLPKPYHPSTLAKTVRDCLDS